MTASSQTEDGAAALLRRACLATAAFLPLATILAIKVPQVWPLWLTSRMVMQQDIWLALLLLAALGLGFLASNRRMGPIVLSGRTLALLVVTTVGLCWAGHYLVLMGYDLTRDEQMAHFDAQILRHGQLVWPLPAVWQGDAKALNLMFMPAVDHPVAWVSAYLPGNAALHALLGDLAGPLLTGLSLPLLWSCARTIWPDDRETANVAVLLLAVSGQFLINGMTAYAMPAHLFFNLLWLRLFLADRRGADLGALAVGWLATGLHQPLFHPLFVAPFLLLLLVQRRWARVAVFAVGYAAIGVFWLVWPSHITALIAGPATIFSPEVSGYVARLQAALQVSSDNLTLTAANLLRLATWQHAALLPLMIAAWAPVRKGGLPAALALGLVLPVVVMAVILPWQGNGFGYRYLHGVLGNAALLGAFGWRHLAALHARLRPAFVAITLAGAVAILPVQFWMSHARYAPFALASRTIDASGADYAVIVAGNGVAYGSVIYNRPDLSNRPIRLSGEQIDDPARLAARICRGGATVALGSNSFFRPGSDYFGVEWLDRADAGLAALHAPYEAAGCRIMLLH